MKEVATTFNQSPNRDDSPLSALINCGFFDNAKQEFTQSQVKCIVRNTYKADPTYRESIMRTRLNNTDDYDNVIKKYILESVDLMNFIMHAPNDLYQRITMDRRYLITAALSGNAALSVLMGGAQVHGLYPIEYRPLTFKDRHFIIIIHDLHRKRHSFNFN